MTAPFTLVVATDFSECSRTALAEAIDLALLRAPSELVLLHVLDVAEGRTLDAMTESEKVAAGMIAEVEKVRPRAELPSTVKLHCHVVRGAPAQRVVDEAIAHRADLIVVGTHGRTGLTRLVLGSVAETIVRLAPCSVLTVKKSSTAAR
jgi:nucleotide-binding universal stress UspA family protein